MCLFDAIWQPWAVHGLLSISWFHFATDTYAQCISRQCDMSYLISVDIMRFTAALLCHHQVVGSVLVHRHNQSQLYFLSRKFILIPSILTRRCDKVAYCNDLDVCLSHRVPLDPPSHAPISLLTGMPLPLILIYVIIHTYYITLYIHIWAHLIPFRFWWRRHILPPPMDYYNSKILINTCWFDSIKHDSHGRGKNHRESFDKSGRHQCNS